jgi:hypothetical protein
LPGQADHVEGVHDRDRVGHFLGGGGFESGKSFHGNDFHSIAPGSRALGEPGLERSFGAAFNHVEQPGRAGLVLDRGQVDDHGDVLVAAACVAPHVFIDPDHPHPVEPVRILDQDALAFAQHRVIGGIPRHREAIGDPGHAQVLAHKGFQRPSQAATGQLGPRIGRLRAVLAPHMTAALAPVAADRDQQCGRPPPKRFVRQLTCHGIPWGALLTAAAAPRVVIGDPACQHRPVCLHSLTSHLQPVRALQAARRGLAIAQDSGNRANETHLAPNLARLEAEHDDPLAALDHVTLAIRNYHDSGSTTLIRTPLAVLVAVLDRLGHHESAATIAGFALSPLTAVAFPEITTSITHLRGVLGDPVYASLARKGEAMTTAAMVTYAYDQIDQARTTLEHPR